MAAQAGLEPATNWLTVNHSTNWVTGQNVGGEESNLTPTIHPQVNLVLHIFQRTYSWICSTFELYPNKILTMPSLTNTVAGTLTLPHTQNKETICIVLSFDCSTTWSTLATHLPSLCLSGLFPLSDPWHSSHRRHIGRLRLNSVSLNLIP